MGEKWEKIAEYGPKCAFLTITFLPCFRRSKGVETCVIALRAEARGIQRASCARAAAGPNADIMSGSSGASWPSVFRLPRMRECQSQSGSSISGPANARHGSGRCRPEEGTIQWPSPQMRRPTNTMPYVSHTSSRVHHVRTRRFAELRHHVDIIRTSACARSSRAISTSACIQRHAACREKYHNAHQKSQ